MRHYIIALCGFVLFVILGSNAASGGGASHAAPPRESRSVAVNLPLPLAHGAAGHEAPAERGGGSTEGGWHHFVSWIGHFHPPMTVFPIAMILSAALAELLRLWTKAPWLDGASRWCMIVGGVGAAITAPLGWAFAVGHGSSWILQVHRWLGTAAGAGAVVLLVLSELARRRGGGTLTLFRVVLFLAVPLVVATGFFGGAMVYGIHEYNWSRPADEHANDSGGAGTQASFGSSSSPNSGVTQITMTDDDAFKPDQVTIPVGTTVRWKNVSKDAHTVTDDPKVADDAKDVSLPAGAKPFNSGKVSPGGTFEQKFSIPGIYRYICEPHEDMNMKGTVIVAASDSSSHPATRPGR